MAEKLRRTEWEEIIAGCLFFTSKQKDFLIGAYDRLALFQIDNLIKAIKAEEQSFLVKTQEVLDAFLKEDSHQRQAISSEHEESHLAEIAKAERDLDLTLEKI